MPLIAVWLLTATTLWQTVSLHRIIYPKESYDECFVDPTETVRGMCTKLAECPVALKRWQHENLAPQTCYFDKFEQYVCCDRIANADVPASTTMRQSSEVACDNSDEYVKSPSWPAIANAQAGQSYVPMKQLNYLAAIGWRSPDDNSTSIAYLCVGILISPKFVLTTAHCLQQRRELPAVVRVGLMQQTTTTDLRIRRHILHEAGCDIGLLELSQPTFGIRPACLWSKRQLSSATVLAITYAGSAALQLLQRPLAVLSAEECRAHWAEQQPPRLNRAVPDDNVGTYICADDLDKVHTRKTDSAICKEARRGGAIVAQLGGSDYLVGMTSFGPGCSIEQPSIYTLMWPYANWIEASVWPLTATSTTTEAMPLLDVRVAS